MNQVLYFIIGSMSEAFLLTAVLLVIYQLKHFVADYVLQTPYMLQKGNPDWSFFKPLLTHTLVHGLLTFAIALWALRDLKWAFLLMAFDSLVHFIMDRLKAAPQYLGRWQLSDDNQTNQLFWMAFGLDQMVHHLTHFVLIAAMISLRFPDLFSSIN